MKLTKNQSYPFLGALKYRLATGYTLSLTLTYLCNLNEKTCPECAMRFLGGLKKVKDSTLMEWQNYITNFPVKIKELYITGGEPQLVPYFVDLCDWALNDGYLVKVFTNLMTDTIYDVRKSPNFSIYAVYHHKSNKGLFLRNWQKTRTKHWIDVFEIETQEIPGSTITPLQTDINELSDSNLIVSPDLKLFTSCADQIINYSIPKTKT